MKKISLVLILLVTFCISLKSQNTKGKKTETTAKFTISGKVTQTQSHCGGAMPTEEELAEIQKPFPYAGKVFYIRKGVTNNVKTGVVMSFTTNGKGEFSFDLPPGKYCLIQKEQVKAFKMADYPIDGYLRADENCLKEWWTTPYYILEVKDKNISGIKFSFYKPCFVNSDIPCIQYTGPMPP